eukprot:3219106-Rhodomonas_salina.2
MDFKRAVLDFSVENGRPFLGMGDWVNNDNDVQACIDVLRVDLSSFGVQLMTACKKHHKEIFVGNDKSITDHLLEELIQWKLLEISFNPFKSSNSAENWKKMNALLAKDLSLDNERSHGEISLHLQAVALLRGQLLTSETEHEIDPKIMGTLVSKLQEASCHDDNGQDIAVRLWREISTRWHLQYETDPRSLSWNDLKISTAKNLARFKPESAAFTAQRPRLAPVAPPGLALAATQEQISNVAWQAQSDRESQRTQGRFED